MNCTKKEISHTSPLDPDAYIENGERAFSMYNKFSSPHQQGEVSQNASPRLSPLSSQMSLPFTSAKYSPTSPCSTPPLPGVSQSPPHLAKLFPRQDLRSPKVKVKTRCLLVTVLALIILPLPLNPTTP